MWGKNPGFPISQPVFGHRHTRKAAQKEEGVHLSFDLRAWMRGMYQQGSGDRYIILRCCRVSFPFLRHVFKWENGKCFLEWRFHLNLPCRCVSSFSSFFFSFAICTFPSLLSFPPPPTAKLNLISQTCVVCSCAYLLLGGVRLQGGVVDHTRVACAWENRNESC